MTTLTDEKQLRQIADAVYEVGKANGIPALKGYATDLHQVTTRIFGAPSCARPPAGWYCTRAPGHDGPCAALPVTP